jgi:hypothetical protein
LLGATTPSAPSTDVPGWEEARWGMTNEAIVKAFGEKAHEAQGASQVRDHARGLRDQKFTLAEESFTVFFQWTT